MKNMIEKPHTISKTIARLGAIQALYSYTINDKINKINLINNIIDCYEQNPHMFYDQVNSELFPNRIKKRLLIDLFNKTLENLNNIDDIISDYMNEDWNVDKLSIVIKSIIRIAVCETIYLSNTPQKVIINEYTNIASQFHSISEVGFINSILENITKKFMENNSIFQASS